jgi:hypothetical protein
MSVFSSPIRVTNLQTLCARIICLEEIQFRGHLPDCFESIIETPMNLSALRLKKRLLANLYQDVTMLGGDVRVNFEISYPQFLWYDDDVETPFMKTGRIQLLSQVCTFVDELIRKLIPHCEHFRLTGIHNCQLLIESLSVANKGKCCLYLIKEIDYSKIPWTYRISRKCAFQFCMCQ